MSEATETKGVFAVTTTKRRRFLWCAWWTVSPTREPFTKPDAWAGGARSPEEARKQAETAAKIALREIDGRWAGAWVRVNAGRDAWPERAPRSEGAPKPRPRPKDDPFVILGLAPSATMTDVKRAFRTLALVHHPDKGGTPAAFLRIKRAFDAIVLKREKRDAKEKRKRREPV